MHAIAGPPRSPRLPLVHFSKHENLIETKVYETRNIDILRATLTYFSKIVISSLNNVGRALRLPRVGGFGLGRIFPALESSETGRSNSG